MVEKRNPKFWVVCAKCNGQGCYRNDVVIGDHLENVFSEESCGRCRGTGYLRRGWAYYDKQENTTYLVPGKFDDYAVICRDPSPSQSDIHTEFLRRGVFLTWVNAEKFQRMEDASMRRDEGAIGDIF